MFNRALVCLSLLVSNTNYLVAASPRVTVLSTFSGDSVQTVCPFKTRIKSYFAAATIGLNMGSLSKVP